MTPVCARWFLLGLLLIGFAGCGKSRPPKPVASDWARRELDGFSLEAPYKFTGNPRPLPGFINLASYMPEKFPQALDIRIDILQQTVNVEAPTLEQFAESVFAFDPRETASRKETDMQKVKVGELDGIRNSAKSKSNAVVEALAFQKGKHFWLIEVYCADESLIPDAKRVLESLKVD